MSFFDRFSASCERAFPDARSTAMIIVIEGISASGKTTWCDTHAREHAVPENGTVSGAPDAAVDAAGAAAFWSDRNADRWRAALLKEEATGIAVCDTDPLKLHYAWCLWQMGDGPQDQWREQHAATRQALLDQRIGFADAYFFKDIDPRVARRRREGDASRLRRNFETHVRMQQPLLAWYRALAKALPQRVEFPWPESLEALGQVHCPSVRYDISVFDRMMSLQPTAPLR